MLVHHSPRIGGTIGSGGYPRAMNSITVASTDGEFAAVRRLFGAYQRAVQSMADDAEICP